MERRIVYVQFTDPAAYPPVEHSSEILAERGWNVVLLGTDVFGQLADETHPYRAALDGDLGEDFYD